MPKKKVTIDTKNHKMSKEDREKTGILFAGIIGGAAFGLLGNLVASYIWNVILGNAGTEKQETLGIVWVAIFVALIAFYYLGIKRLLSDKK